MFVPPRVAPQRYEVFVSDEAIDRVVERLRASGAPWPPGAWTIEREDLFDAFGADGPYRRDKIAWLYDGLRPRVARGPLMRDGRAIGGVTLISPYPDAQLRDLKPGTLAILVHVRTRRDRP